MKKLTAILLFVISYMLFVPPVFAACNPDLGPCPAGLQDLSNLVGRIVSVAVGLGFVIMFTMLVWAGFKYLTSGGEPKQIQSAHNIVTWAFLGIIFMAIAWLVLQLIGIITGQPITTFNIGVLCKPFGPGGADFCK